MATGPTFSAYQQSNWADTPTPGNEVTPSLSWTVGDLIVVVGMTEGTTLTLGVPTATGLTFSVFLSSTQASQCQAYVWTAIAPSTSSGAITSVGSNNGVMGGIAAFAITGHTGIGNTAAVVGTAAKTISLDRGHANSGVICVQADFTANADVTVTCDPASGGTQRGAVTQSGRASFYLCSWTDQGATAITPYGVGSLTGTVQITGFALEIVGLEAPEVPNPRLQPRLFPKTQMVRRPS